jgi:rhombotail lipoprotein
MKYTTRTLVAMCAATLLAGCTGLWQALSGPPREGTSSSLVDFLYPSGEEPPAVDDVVPYLDLPVRVGIAFVPAASGTDATLSEARKSNLLADVRAAFVDRDFIASIEVIPESYLRSGRGFDAVDQVARLYDLDVIALVSYDQVSVSEDTKASILYWTIIGAYFIPASAHDVHTLVDTAVFDVKTRKLLFRAPGSNTLKETSTLVDSPKELREQRDKSFSAAMRDMTGNLAKELDVFKSRVETEGVVTVSKRDGGGSADLALVALLLAACVASSRRRA